MTIKPTLLKIFPYYAQNRQGRRLLAKQWPWFPCWIMNKIDFRYWFCECEYYVPYGLVVMGGCKYHD